MITEKELYDWLKPIANWGDLLTYNKDRGIVTYLDSCGQYGLEIRTEFKKITLDPLVITAKKYALVFEWSNLRLWRCSELPGAHSDCQTCLDYGLETKWSLVSAYKPKEETVTIPKAEYDKMKRRYEAWKGFIDALDKK